MIIKTGDIVQFITSNDQTVGHGEIGPGKTYHDEHSVSFEVFPMEQFKYADSQQIDFRQITKHFPVRKARDFYKAWVSLGYNPIVDSDEVLFEPLFENNTTEEPVTEPVFLFKTVEDLWGEQESDDNRSLRSVDSFSTVFSSETETDSFVVEDPQDEFHEHDCDCTFCTTTKDSVRWFDQQWRPTDDTESKVKSFIEYLEEKYT